MTSSKYLGRLCYKEFGMIRRQGPFKNESSWNWTEHLNELPNSLHRRQNKITKTDRLLILNLLRWKSRLNRTSRVTEIRNSFYFVPFCLNQCWKFGREMRIFQIFTILASAKGQSCQTGSICQGMGCTDCTMYSGAARVKQTSTISSRSRRRFWKLYGSD